MVIHTAGLSKGAKETVAAVQEWCAQNGIECELVPRRGKHPTLRLSFAGTTRKVSFAATASDWRAGKNTLAIARSVAREMGWKPETETAKQEEQPVQYVKLNRDPCINKSAGQKSSSGPAGPCEVRNPTQDELALYSKGETAIPAPETVVKTGCPAVPENLKKYVGQRGGYIPNAYVHLLKKRNEWAWRGIDVENNDRLVMALEATEAGWGDCGEYEVGMWASKHRQANGLQVRATSGETTLKPSSDGIAPDNDCPVLPQKFASMTGRGGRKTGEMKALIERRNRWAWNHIDNLKTDRDLMVLMAEEAGWPNPDAAMVSNWASRYRQLHDLKLYEKGEKAAATEGVSIVAGTLQCASPQAVVAEVFSKLAAGYELVEPGELERLREKAKKWDAVVGAVGAA